MNKLLVIVSLLMGALSVYGQSDTIDVRKGAGAVFSMYGKNLKPKQLLEMMDTNPRAYEEMKIAKTNNDVGAVFGVVGGFLIGYPLGTYIAGGEPNWTVAGIGAGLAEVSIPFSVAYARHARNAVRIYNEGVKQISYEEIEFRLGMTNNGLGVRVTF